MASSITKTTKAGGGYQRVSANGSDDAAAVDPAAMQHPFRPPSAPVEHHGRARMRVLVLAILVFLLIVVFFEEFGSTIRAVRGGIQSRFGGYDDAPDVDGQLNGSHPLDSEDAGDVAPTNDDFGEEVESEDELEDSDVDSGEEGKASYNMTGAQPEVSSELLTSSWSADAMQKRCPNWSPEFAREFEEKCKYWIPVFAGWEQALAETTSQNSVSYVCLNDKDCHGWGDRIAGMESAFLRALRDTRRFKLAHPYLDQVFYPCLFQNRHAQWTAQKYAPLESESCFDDTTNCDRWNRITCSKPNLVARNGDRTCFHPLQCEGIAKIMPDFSSANLAGCAMRAMFEPKRQYLETTEFDFRAFGKTRTLTLKAIREYLASYYVIGIHVRLGDADAFGGPGKLPKTNDFFRPIRCAQTLESYLADESLRVNGKKVIWLLATDSYWFKERTFARFKDKIVGFDFKPKHIANPGSHNIDDLGHAVGEWYILGLSDQIIVTKWNSRGDIFDDYSKVSSRLSGFSRSTWLYNLKETVYFAGTCELEMVALTGLPQITSLCKNSTRLTWKPPQPHLEILRQENKSFPEYYVQKGKVLPRS